MKQLVVATAVLAALGLINVANAAEQHTVTLGYAQTKIQDADFLKPKGVNVKYRYEWDAPVSIISSFTYTSAKGDNSYYLGRDYMQDEIKAKSYSLLVGPAYRVNDYFSAYALVGVNHTKLEYQQDWTNYSSHGMEYMGKFTGSKSATNLAYGLGLQINPMANVAIDLAYERSQVTSFYDNKLSTNSFNIGAGYRF